MKIKNLLSKLVSKEPLKDKISPIEIESELIELAAFIQRVTKKRSLEDVEDRLGTSGWLGQEIFNGILLQNKVPNLYANPIYEEQDVFRKISDKHFDFYIPTIGYLSIKTVPEGVRKVRFMVDVDQWQDEIHDIAVAIKIVSLKERNAVLYGWLYEREVESLPIAPKGETPISPNADAYWTYLDPKKVQENKYDDQPGKSSTKLIPLRPACDLLKLIFDTKKYTKNKVNKTIYNIL